MIHLTATYVDAQGAPHHLEMWRAGDRLRRDTDDKLSLFVTHDRRGNDRYRVVDRARHLGYTVTRTNLYRLGNFADWTTLTTLLAPTLQKLAPTGEPDGSTPAGRCRWSGDAAHRVCFSSKWGLPLMLAEKRGGAWQTVLTVEKLHAAALEPALFQPPADAREIDVDRDAGPQD